MAITYDTGATYDHTATTSSSQNVTLGASATILVVGTDAANDAAPSSITYNSVGLTKEVSGNPAINPEMSIWYLNQPGTGASYALVKNYASSSAGAGVVASYNGTDTSDPVGATGTGDNDPGGTSVSANITTDTANSWVFHYIRTGSGAGGFTPDSPSVERQDFAASNRPVDIASGDLATTNAGAYTPGWTWVNSKRGLMLALEIHAGAAAVVASRFTGLSVLGVGQ